MKKRKLLFVGIGLMASILIHACTPSQKSTGYGMVATLQLEEEIEGVCDNSNVIAILPIPGNGQVKAKAPMTDNEITDLLNSEVQFLDGKLDYEDKGMVMLIINCEGDMVQCSTSNKTKSEELDAQIVKVFSTMKEWKPGTINGKPVDTSVLYSFTITDGEITL